MKLSGHNFKNEVFDSLLENMQSDIVILKKAQKEEPKVDMNFTHTTQNDYDEIISDELKFAASELIFAAKNANVEITGDDLKIFSEQAMSEKLRGKSLERAARKYCSKLNRNFTPIGTQKISSVNELIDSARSGSVIPANYPSNNMNNSSTGGYMGMSKNPNTIWDSDALQKIASKPENYIDMAGDEKIKQSMKNKEDHKLSQKTALWEEIKMQSHDPLVVKNSISNKNVSTQETASFNPNLPKNSMSMFNSDRDFNNIPQKTDGESIKEISENRSKKASGSKEEWNKVSAAKKTNNTIESAFDDKTSTKKSSSQRSATDRLFEGMLAFVNKKSKSA